MPELGRINVFYSYAHKDEAYREKLVEWLSALREERIISDWYDRKITPGADWESEITQNLGRSHVVLFLISPAFMQSDYSIGVEVKEALELHWNRRCRIVPVILQPTPEWTSTEFGTFQALPKDAKAISEWPRQEAAYLDIAEGLRKVCKEIVDWENPFRRAVIGDWTQIEQTIRAPGQTVVARVRLNVVAKDLHAATIHTVASAQAVGGVGENREDRELRIPLEQPLEDNFQSLFNQFKVNIPANSSFWREETGRGEQKLFVGGTPYYCTWSGNHWRFDTGELQLILEAKTWRCIDVPLDGIVKAEGLARNELGQVFLQSSQLLTGYGHGTGE